MRGINKFYRLTLSAALLLSMIEGSSVSAETAKKSVNVKAPFVTVDGAGTKVRAPFVNYDSASGATVSAPFVDVAPGGDVRVNAPFVNVDQSGAHVKAPFVNVDSGQVKAPFVNLTGPAKSGVARQALQPAHAVAPLTPSSQTVSPNSGLAGGSLASPDQFPHLGTPGVQPGLGQAGSPGQLAAPGQSVAPGQFDAPGQITSPGKVASPGQFSAPRQAGGPAYSAQPAGSAFGNFLGKFINVENSPTGGIHVKAPFVDVNTGSGNVDVKAPFVDVHR